MARVGFQSAIRSWPPASGIVVEPFDSGRHDRSGFSCGTDRLDSFLRFSARKQQKDKFTRVFVAVAADSRKVLGYHALKALAVQTDDLGADRSRRAPNKELLVRCTSR